MSISDLVPKLQRLVPGVPAPAATRYLRDALVEFCEKTEGLQVDLAAIHITADTRDYELTPAVAASIARVVGVFIQTADDAADDLRGTRVDESRWSLVDGDPMTLWLDWKPSGEEGSLIVVVALVPDDDMPLEEIDDTFLRRWGDAFIAGAAAELLSMERRWRNLREAQRQAIVFGSYISQAKNEMIRGMQDVNPVMEV